MTMLLLASMLQVLIYFSAPADCAGRVWKRTPEPVLWCGLQSGDLLQGFYQIIQNRNSLFLPSWMFCQISGMWALLRARSFGPGLIQIQRFSTIQWRESGILGTVFLVKQFCEEMIYLLTLLYLIVCSIYILKVDYIDFLAAILNCLRLHTSI